MRVFGELDAILHNLQVARRTRDFLVRNRPRGELDVEYDNAIQRLDAHIEKLNQTGNDYYKLIRERKRSAP